jgi:hypothetical protein
VNVFLRVWRRCHPESYIRVQMRGVARELRNLNTKRRANLSAIERRNKAAQLEQHRHEFYEWQLEIEDKKLIKRAGKIGVYLDEITFPDIPDDRNVGRYYCIGTYGNELLRDEFRTPLLRAVREREPVWRKERREQIELFTKVIAALATAATGIIGALIGLLAIRR